MILGFTTCSKGFLAQDIALKARSLGLEEIGNLRILSLLGSFLDKLVDIDQFLVQGDQTFFNLLGQLLRALSGLSHVQCLDV